MDDVLQKFMPKFIDEQPTVDAVEVVRCRDCKYSYCNKYCTNDQWKDGLGTICIEPDDFCSYAEPRTAQTTHPDEPKTHSGLIEED